MQLSLFKIFLKYYLIICYILYLVFLISIIIISHRPRFLFSYYLRRWWMFRDHVTTRWTTRLDNIFRKAKSIYLSLTFCHQRIHHYIAFRLAKWIRLGRAFYHPSKSHHISCRQLGLSSLCHLVNHYATGLYICWSLPTCTPHILAFCHCGMCPETASHLLWIRCLDRFTYPFPIRLRISDLLPILLSLYHVFRIHRFCCFFHSRCTRICLASLN